MVLLESLHLSILDLSFLSVEESFVKIKIAKNNKRILHMMLLRKLIFNDCQGLIKISNISTMCVIRY